MENFQHRPRVKLNFVCDSENVRQTKIGAEKGEIKTDNTHLSFDEQKRNEKKKKNRKTANV